MIRHLVKQFYNRYKGRIKRLKSPKIGRTTFLAPKVQILGLDKVEIGNDCTIGEGTLITINNREERSISFKVHDNVYIGRENFFTVGEMEIKEYCIFGNRCSFLSSNHKFDDPMVPYSLSGSSSNMRIEIGVNCWLGHNVSVVGDVKIGHGSVVGANSCVVDNLPPFSLAVGNPARVIKRFNFTSGIWEKCQEVERSPFFDENVYLVYLKENYPSTPIGYHASTYSFGDL